MRLKDPFSLKTTDMTKRTNKPKKPRDEESSDEVSGLTCQHVSKAVELNSVKKAVTGSLWSVCSDCMKERDVMDMQQAGTHDIRVCLKCGFQGCSQSESQHSVKHQQAHHSDSHCISISLSTWKAWCFECNEELSTHCNKKALAQTVDFLQKHSAKSASGTTSKLIKLLEEPAEYSDPQRGKSPANSTLIPVKGINNLGNTCFFNAVMQVIYTHTHTHTQCAPPQCIPTQIQIQSPIRLIRKLSVSVAPRFKGYQQQDSQELLHYLLDSVRVEESKVSVFAIMNVETTYGKEGVKMNFVDRIFVGELTNTIMCEECEHISTVKEAFIDISLPIIEERISKPTNPGRLVKTGRDQDALGCHVDEAPHSQANRNSRRPSGQKLQGYRSSTCCDERGAESPQKHEDDTSLTGRSIASFQTDTTGSQSDASDKDSSPQDSSNDADSEASESEWSPRVSTVPIQSSTSNKASPSAKTSSRSPSSFPTQSPTPSTTHSSIRSQQGGAVEQLVSAVSKLGLVHTPLDPLALSHGLETTTEKEKERASHQGAFQALSHSYTPASKECSVQSCLHQFTSVELLMGNNKLLCENCTERRHRQLRRSGGADKKSEKVYTSARKQMLISVLPPVVTLHLKRFHQAGMNLRKVNRHVDFPLILDLAPFCSASCKSLGSGEKVLYSLYGIVEHSGSMRGGHYTAYVKVRTPQRKSEQRRNQSGSREAVSAPPGQWVYVSDTSVQTVPESRVMNSQAYLLFYEELL
uniref:Ubiquitin carboxyl-terminal hydrolase n=1 Tax=Astyanax mexicanus TaxID=7994 RepID=A0A8B9K8P8_ASTMX